MSRLLVPLALLAAAAPTANSHGSMTSPRPRNSADRSLEPWSTWTSPPLEPHFSSNGVSTLAAKGGGSVGGLTKLHSLFLEGNALASWEAIEPIGGLPALRLLNVNFNKLAAIPPLAERPGFAELRHLMLRGNPLDAWAVRAPAERAPPPRCSLLPLRPRLPLSADLRRHSLGTVD